LLPSLESTGGWFGPSVYDRPPMLRADAPALTATRPRVDVLALGGTIAMTADDPAQGVTPTLSAATLVEAVPGLDALADVHAQTVRALPGASLDFPDLTAAIGAARACVDTGSDGVIVMQGTDSLEETAYALHLLWDRAEPLVVTGAMRPASAPGADGPANLRSAVVVAAAPAARDRGCLVVFADEVHAARDVAKVHSTRPHAFASPGTGPVGWVSEDNAWFAAPAAGQLQALVPSERAVPSVALVSALLGDSGRQLRAIADAGFDGLVLAAMGGGHVPERLLPVLAEFIEQFPVVATSRTGAGRLLRSTYGFAGSEHDLHRLGLLDGCGLAPLKARVLLTLALWCELDRQGAEELFARRAAA
jgi:L-asparaginase